MSQLSPPRCRYCQTILAPPGYVCADCGKDQDFAPIPADQRVTKSFGGAVVLTLLYPGLGHFYVGRRPNLGIKLLVTMACLGVLAFTVVGLVVAIPASLAVLVYALRTVSQDVNAVNGTMR